MKISDTEIGMICAFDARWPSVDTNVAWRHLHDAVTAIRQTVRDADLQISSEEENGDLSTMGKIRAMGNVGLALIAVLQNLPELTRAEASVTRMVEHFAKGSTMPIAPTEVADVLMAQELRAHVAKQKKPKPIDFLLKRKNDACLVAAVMHAPAYLSGLSDEEKNLFIREAEIALFPGASGDKNALLKALDQLRSGVKKAERMIGDRAQLLNTGDGWTIKLAAAWQAA